MSAINLILNIEAKAAQAQIKAIKTDILDIAGKNICPFDNANIKSTGDSLVKAFNDGKNSAGELLARQQQIVAAMALAGQSGTKEFRAAQAELVSAKKSADEFEKAMQKAMSPPQSGFGETMFKFNQTLEATQKIAGVLGGVIDFGEAFNKNLKAVGAFTGTSGKELDSLGDKARTLGKDFADVGGATEQLEVFSNVLSKLGPEYGKNSDAMAIFAKNINVLAKAGGMDLKTSSEAMTGAMLQFGLATGDANKDAETSTRVINAIAQSARSGAAQIPQVTESLNQVGATARGVGLSLNETLAAIQTLSKSGKTGAEAGTALRNVISLIQKPAGEGAIALQKMGIESRELAIAMREDGLHGALTKIRDGMGKVSDSVERGIILQQMFGLENKTAAQNLIDNLDKYKQFEGEIEQGTKGVGTAMEMFNQKSGSVGGYLAKWKAQITDTFITANNMMGTFPAAVLKASTSLAPMVLSFTQLQPIISNVGGKALDMFKSFGSSAIEAAKGLSIHSIATGISTGATTALATAQSALNAAFVASPVGWVVVGVLAAAAAIYLLYTRCEPVRNAINSVWEVIKIGAASTWNFLKTTFTTIGDFLQGSIGLAITGVVLTAQILWETFKFGANLMIAVCKPAWDGVASAFNFIATSVKSVYDYTSGLVSKFIETVTHSTALKIALGALLLPFAPLIAAFYGGYKAVMLIAEGFQKAGSVGNFVKGMLAGVSAAFDEFKSGIVNMWNALIHLNFSELANSFTNMTSKVKEAFTNGFDNTVAKEKGAQLAAAAQQGMTENAPTVQINPELNKNRFNDIKGEISRISQQIADGALAGKDITKAYNDELKQITRSTNTGEITAAQSKQLQAELKAAVKNNKAKADNSRQTEDKLGNDLAQKAEELENLKLQLAAKRQTDQTKRELMELEAKQQKELAAYDKQLRELESKRKNSKLSEAAKLDIDKEIDIVKESMSVKRQIQETELSEFYKKVIEQENKRLDDIAKKTDEINKAKLEALKLSSESATGDDYIKNLEAQKALSIQMINDETKQKIDAIVKQTKEVQTAQEAFVRAQSNYRVASATSDTSLIDAAKTALDATSAELDKAKDKVIESDEQIKAIKLKNQDSIKDATAKSDYEIKLAKINQTEDIAKRDYEIAIATAQKKYSDELAAARGNNAAILAAKMKLSDELIKADQDYLTKAKPIMATAVDGINALATGITFDFTLKSDNSAAKSAEKDISKLKAQYAQGKIAANEYYNQMSDLQDKVQESQAKRQSAFISGINKGLSASAQAMQKTSTLMLAKSVENYDKIRQAGGDTSNAMSQIFQTGAASVASAGLQALADGKNIGKAMIAQAFDMLQAMVPIWTAQITGFSLASAESVMTAGIAGLAKAAGITALLTVAIQAAKAAATGFFVGGWTGDGNEHDVAGVVHKREVVVNAKSAAIGDNRQIAEAMNRGLDVGKLINATAGLTAKLAGDYLKLERDVAQTNKALVGMNGAINKLASFALTNAPSATIINNSINYSSVANNATKSLKYVNYSERVERLIQIQERHTELSKIMSQTFSFSLELSKEFGKFEEAIHRQTASFERSVNELRSDFKKLQFERKSNSTIEVETSLKVDDSAIVRGVESYKRRRLARL